MRVLVRWIEEVAMYVETEDPNLLEEGLPGEDLSEAELLETSNWTWEYPEEKDPEAHPLKKLKEEPCPKE